MHPAHEGSATDFIEPTERLDLEISPQPKEPLRKPVKSVPPDNFRV